MTFDVFKDEVDDDGVSRVYGVYLTFGHGIINKHRITSWMAVAAKTPDAASVQNFRLHLPYQAFL